MALDLKFEWNQPFRQNSGNFWFEHSWDDIFYNTISIQWTGTMSVEAVGLFPKNQYYLPLKICLRNGGAKDPYKPDFMII